MLKYSDTEKARAPAAAKRKADAAAKTARMKKAAPVKKASTGSVRGGGKAAMTKKK